MYTEPDYPYIHREASVRFAETWIIAALRERKFFSVREVNEAVVEKLEELETILPENGIPIPEYDD